MDPAVKWALGKPAIGPGDDVLAPDQSRQPHDALGHQFRVLDHVGGVADDAGNEHPARWQFGSFPHPPFVLVARIGSFDDKCADFHAEDEIDDVLERNVAGMRPRPTAPADVIADALKRQTGNRLVENIDLQRQPFAVLLE